MKQRPERNHRPGLRPSLLLACLLAALGGCSVNQSVRENVVASAQAQPKNVLLIIADDLNTRLGAYGADVDTPNIDRFARQAVRFDRAYSQFPLCGPSRASMLTGTRPNTIGPAADFENFRCAMPDIQTLPQYFKQHGYFSARIGKAYHQGVPSDIGRSGPDDPASWTEVVNPRGRDKDLEKQLINHTPGVGLGRAMAYHADEAGADEDHTDGKVATAAIEMLKANADKPFFITVGFYRPHVPEIAPKKYFDRYPLARIPAPTASEPELAGVLPAAKTSAIAHVGMNTQQQREMIAAYSAATSFVDAQVGRVLRAVDELGLGDNTVVVFIGDHGFMLGEHGQWAKSLLWEESARTPMLIRAPQVRGGTASTKPVELLDLYPTLTQLAGLPQYARNEGKSLVPLLARPNDPAWSKPALSQVFGGRSVRTERWRYTEWEEGRLGKELYDHASDPHERNNLAANPAMAATVQQLKAMLPNGPVEKRRINPEDGRPRKPRDVMNHEGPTRTPCIAG